MRWHCCIRDFAQPEHRAYLASHSDIILLSGATQSDDGTKPTGSTFLLVVNSREKAEAFVKGDPFDQHGVFASVHVTRMRQGQWNPQLADRIVNAEF